MPTLIPMRSLSFLLIPLIFLASCSIDWNDEKDKMECLRIILPIINTWLIAYVGYYIWKKQEILKTQKEHGLKFLSLLKQYKQSIDNLRNGRFKLYDSEANIYEERWNHLIKIWIELQNEYTLTELFYNEQKSEITLTKLAELQNVLWANLDTYLDRKCREKWKGDTSDKEIAKILFKSNNESDDFGEEIQNEINALSNPIKTQLSQQFNTKF